jgi:hypothetical protein
MIEDDSAKACPHCHQLLSEEVDAAQLTKAQEKRIAGMVWRKHRNVLIGEVSVLGALGLISLIVFFYQAYKWANAELSKNLVSRVENEFQTERIKVTVEQVAAAEAKSLLQNQIAPEVAAFKVQTENRVVEFEKYLADLKARYEADHKELAGQLAELKARNLIAAYGDRATSGRDRDALVAILGLAKMTSNEQSAKLADHPSYIALKDGARANVEQVHMAANAEIARIKKFWIDITGVKGRMLSNVGDSGIGIIPAGQSQTNDESLKTNVIIGGLTNDNWMIRCLAAQGLGKRKELGVPEALLKCALSDKNLEVVRDALASFSSVTEFVNADILGWDRAQVWWSEHANEVNAKLKNPDAKTGT